MDKVHDILISCWNYVTDYVIGIANSISEAFTGADSSSALILLIFYLSVAIIILLLLIFLVKSIRSFFATLFGKKTKKKKGAKLPVQPKQSAPVSPAPEARVVAEERRVVPCMYGNPCVRGVSLYSTEGFDGQVFLDQLSSTFNNINNSYKETFAPQRIEAIVPNLPVELDIAGETVLTAEDKEAFAKRVDGQDLMALRLMLSAEETKRSDIEGKINVVRGKISSRCDEREKLAREETSVLEQYNDAVEELLGLVARSEQQKELLSIEYSKLYKQISDLVVLRNELLNGIESFHERIQSVPNEVESFGSVYDSNLSAILAECVKKDGALSALNRSYKTIRDSRVKADDIIGSLQEPLVQLCNERIIQAEFVAYLRTKISELEALETARLAREEAARLNQGTQTQQAGAVSTVDAVMASVKEQARDAYALNYDDISPETYAKIAQYRKNIPTKAGKPADGPQAPDSGDDGSAGLVSESTPVEAAVEPEAAPEIEQAGQGSDSEEPAESVESVEAVEPTESVEPAEPAEPDYFAELQQQWAAERDHKKQWQAEQEQRKAEAERRMKELSGNAGASGNS